MAKEFTHFKMCQTRAEVRAAGILHDRLVLTIALGAGSEILHLLR